MNIEFNKPNLYYVFLKNLHHNGDYVANLVSDNFQRNLVTIEKMQTLANSKGSPMSNEKYAQLLREVSTVYLDGKDYLKILSEKYCKNFIGFTTISTTMTRNTTITEGHGHSFDYWNEEIGTEFDIVYTDDANIEENHHYSIAEIKALIADKKIILIYERDVKDSLPRKKEDYENFPVLNLYTIQYHGPLTPKYFKYLRKKITPERITRELRKYLEELEHDIESIHSFSSPITYENNIALKCYTSQETNGYLKQLMKIKKDQK